MDLVAIWLPQQAFNKLVSYVETVVFKLTLICVYLNEHSLK